MTTPCLVLAPPRAPAHGSFLVIVFTCHVHTSWRFISCLKCCCVCSVPVKGVCCHQQSPWSDVTSCLLPHCPPFSRLTGTRIWPKLCRPVGCSLKYGDMRVAALLFMTKKNPSCVSGGEGGGCKPRVALTLKNVTMQKVVLMLRELVALIQRISEFQHWEVFHTQAGKEIKDKPTRTVSERNPKLPRSGSSWLQPTVDGNKKCHR